MTIVKYLCKSEGDLMTHIKERRILASTKNREDRRSNRSVKRNVKHADNNENQLLQPISVKSSHLKMQICQLKLAFS